MIDFDLIQYLSGKGVHGYRSGDNYRVPCFFHQGDDKNLSIRFVEKADQEIGVFHCFTCGEHGGLSKILTHFGDEVPKAAAVVDKGRGVLQEAAEFYMEQMTPELLSWLRHERGLSLEAIRKHRFGYAPGDKSLMRHLMKKGFSFADMTASGLVTNGEGGLVDTFNDDLTFCYQVEGSVVMIRARRPPWDNERKYKYKSPPHIPGRLFNSEVCWTKPSTVVIAEGEIDCITLDDHGIPAVGVPGANIWRPTWTDYFADVERILVAFDPDEAGKEGAAKLKMLFGRKVQVLDLPESTDVNSFFQSHSVQEWDELVNASRRKSTLLQFATDANTKRQEILHYEESHPGDAKKFGMDLLDHAIAPGFRSGQVMVVLAKPGTGKTITAINWLHRFAERNADASMLYLSLEQTSTEWLDRAERIWNFHNLHTEPEDVTRRTVEWWGRRLAIMDRNRLTEDQARQCIDELSEQAGKVPDLVVVDYLGYYARSFRGDEYDRTTSAIMGLKGIAKDMGTRFIVLSQLSRQASFGREPQLDQGKSSGAIEETADFGFTMWSEDSADGRDASERNGLINTRVAKSRHGNKGTLLQFQFAPLTLALAPMEEGIKARMAKDELDWATDPRVDWRLAIERHRFGHPGIAAPGLRLVGAGT